MTKFKDLSTLNYFFKPRSVAVVGASRDFSKMSGKPTGYLRRHGFYGKVFPINPKYEEICGFKAYPDIGSVPEEVDLALIALPADQVVGAVQACAAKGIKAVTIIAGGFSEVQGPEEKEREGQLRKIAQETGIRICGPNTMGTVNLYDRVAANFSGGLDLESLIPGPIGLITQSGALGAMIFYCAQKEKIGLSLWVAMGNEADVKFCEWFSYLALDSHTNVICAYMESLKEDGRNFVAALDIALEKRKPVVVLKVGRSEKAQVAAISHTGAILSPDEGYEAVFRQKGVIRAQNKEELLDFAYMFAADRLPKSNRVGIVSMSGGAGVIMIDDCFNAGLELPEFTEEINKRLKKIVPPIGSAVNPVDLTGYLWNQPSLLKEAVSVLVDDENIDIILVFLGLMGSVKDELINHIKELYRSTHKPMAVTWSAGPYDVYPRLKEEGIPIFNDPTRCVKAIGALVKYKNYIDESDKKESGHYSIGPIRSHNYNVILSKFNDSQRNLTEHQSKEILRRLNLPVPKGFLVNNQQEALSAARKIGFPVVLKIQSTAITHKTEIGGVKLGLVTTEQVLKAYNQLALKTQNMDGILVEEMVTGGLEVIIGVSRHPIFGPLIMFGIGGIYTEIYKDVSFRVAPISEFDAVQMIKEIKGSRLLTGARGRPKSDINELVKVLIQISKLAMEFGDYIYELDINPLAVFEDGKGVKILDALIIKPNP
jgi:acyl-CoA synthetase (NDP forming)